MTKNKKMYNEQAVTELQIYTENDRQIYDRELKPVYVNLAKKQKKGIYKPEEAQKSYYRIASNSAKNYNKKFGSSDGTIFTTADRREVAKRLEADIRDELQGYLK